MEVWGIVLQTSGGMIMFGKKEKRFSVKEMESYSGSGTIRIIDDTKTGVNYIMTEGVGGSSITPLLDSNGKVMIEK